MGLTTTALLTEFLVVGSLAWLWIVPLICWFYSIPVGKLFELVGNVPPSIAVLVVFGTYVIGAFTESLSFAVEKLAVGKTLNPREWYKRKVAIISDADWHAAQEAMWESEYAFREFSQTKLRTGISRGALVNGFLAIFSILFVGIFGTWERNLLPILAISMALVVISPVSWWFAQVEHTARVKVAGVIEGKKKDMPRRGG